MKTAKTNVEGKCYIWAIPKTDWEIKQDLEKMERSKVVPFRYIIKSSSSDYRDEAVMVHEFDVLGTVPEGVDLITAAVKTLREEIIRVRKEADDRIGELEVKIKNLALIEYRPEVIDAEVDEVDEENFA